jgi:hypothetical protein
MLPFMASSFHPFTSTAHIVGLQICAIVSALRVTIKIDNKNIFQIHRKITWNFFFKHCYNDFYLLISNTSNEKSDSIFLKTEYMNYFVDIS